VPEELALLCWQFIHMHSICMLRPEAQALQQAGKRC
jgi:hypothetical protein